jgi:hypothetical protein
MPYRCRGCRGRFYVKVEGEAPLKTARKSGARKNSRHGLQPFWARPGAKRQVSEWSIAGASVVAFAVFLYLLSRGGTGF